MVMSLLPLAAMAVPIDNVEPTREVLTDTLIKEKFFRKSVGILWTYFGEDTRSYALQMRHGFISSDVLPNAFGKIGLVPTAVVGDIIYESNPAGESGDAIWSRATAYYDNLFDYEFLEGRVIYQDIKLDAYLGAGIGFVPVHNSWIGGYYLGSDGFMFSAESAKALNEDFWIYGDVQYYTDNDDWKTALEGEIGVVYDDLIYATLQNRGDEFIYMMGVSYSLE